MVPRTARRARRPSSPAARPRRKPGAAPLPATPAAPSPYPFPGRLKEEPHAHIVCRRCGRISTVHLAQLDLFELELLADRRPKDWTVDGVTYSLTGHCPRCSSAGAR